MTNMPVLDKNSGMQNILSAKGTKPAASSENGSFNTVLKQTTEAGRQSKNGDSGRKTEAAKASESKGRTEDTAARDKLNNNRKAEEKTGTKETEAQAKAEGTEEITEDTEVLEKAGGEMVAALAAQMGLTQEAVREAMEELGMTDVSLLDPKNLKSLMVELTEGADEMSLLMDEDFYNSVTEALNTLEGIIEEAQEESGMSPEEFSAAVLEAQKKLGAADVSEEMQEMAADENLEETGAAENNTVRFNTPKPELTENARTETAVPKDAPKQESTGKEGESPFMQNSYQTQNVEQQAQALKAAEAESAFSMTDTQEIMDQILDYMKVSVKPEMTSLEMQLHPESLGTLHIQISNREGAVTAQFIAQNESVRAVLESQMMELKENLEQQGIKVEAVEVTIAQYSLDRNPDGNAESSQQQSRQGRRGIRNLNLGELNPEEEEELTEEEKLAAEVMKSEGSTVSYMA